MQSTIRSHKKQIITAGLVIALGILYYVLVTTTEFRIPCLFHLVTGLKCPGCGVSTMLVEASHLDFAAAFAANPYLFVTAPFIIFEIIYSAVLTLKKKENPKANEIALWIYIAGLLVFAVLRNIL